MPLPAVINQALAARLNLTPGSSLRLRVIVTGATSALPPTVFDVVGVAEFRFDSADEYVVATTFEGYQRARASTVDTADLILVASKQLHTLCADYLVHTHSAVAQPLIIPIRAVQLGTAWTVASNVT